MTKRCAGRPSPRRFAMPSHVVFALAASISLLTSNVVSAQEGSAAPAEGAVTLQQIVAYAQEHAPRLLVARSRAAFATAERAEAAPFFSDDPQLGFAVGPRIGGSVGLDVEASLTQRIEVAGEPFLRRQAAERAGDALRAELHAEESAVRRSVHSAFHVARVALARGQVLRDAEVFAREVLDIATARARAGDISPLQETLARTEHARARQALQTALQDSFAARLVLAEVSGWSVEPPPLPAGALQAAKTSQTQARLLELAVSQQERLQARSAAVAVARARLAVAERAAWPKPELGVAYALEGGGVAPLVGEQVVLGTIGIPLPLWQRDAGGRTRAAADVALAEAELQAARLELPAKLARARSRVDAAADRVLVYERDIVPAVDGTLSLLRKAFELGEVDVMEVMLGRERVLAARREHLDAYDEYFRARDELDAEIGADGPRATAAP